MTGEQSALQRAGCGKAARPDSVRGTPCKGRIYSTTPYGVLNLEKSML